MAVDAEEGAPSETDVAGRSMLASEDSTKDGSASQVRILEANGETHEYKPLPCTHCNPLTAPLRSLSCIHR